MVLAKQDAMKISKMTLAILVIPAIYWSPPASNFNIVQAAVQTNGSGSILNAHALMSRTHLKAAMAYLDGLEEQLKADVPLEQREFKGQLSAYEQSLSRSLHQARTHFDQLVSSLSRAPASVEEDSKTQLSKSNDGVLNARRDWQKIGALEGQLKGRLSAAGSADKNELLKLVAELRSETNSAIGKMKSLHQ